MKSKLIALLLCIAMILGVAACGPREEPEPVVTGDDKPAASVNPYDQEDVIYIGSVQELTGSKTAGGIPCSYGVRLAVKVVNEKGGVLGKQIVLVEEDAMETPQDAITALTKMLDGGKVSAVLTSCFSSTGIALSPTIREYQVPSFCLGSSANVFEDGNPYFWQVRVTDDYASISMIEATATLGVKNPGFIFTSNSYGMGLEKLMVEYLEEKYNTKPAAEISFNSGETNFAPLITQLVNSGCDGIVAVADAAEATLIMKQVKAMNVNLPCVGSSPFASAETIKNAGAAAEGWYSVAEWTEDFDTEISKQFVADFNEMYPDAMVIQNVAYAYDATYLLFEAIKLAGSAEPEAVNKALSQIEGFQGVIAELTPNENRSFAKSQLLIQTQADGSSKIIEIITIR